MTAALPSLPTGLTSRPATLEDADAITEQMGAVTAALIGYPKHSFDDVSNYLRDPPARVGGGPGTGKTIVALHRVQHLVDTLPPGHDKPVLLTTYNKNLAADLRSRLLELGGPELLSRSKSACSAAFFGRFGLVRLSTKVAIAPASRAARHSMMWE